MWLGVLGALVVCAATSVPSREWVCPDINRPPSATCSCDLPHTLRCAGDRSALRVIGRALRGLPGVSLLDCTVQDVVSLVDPVLEISTVHKSSFYHNRDILWLLTRNFVTLSPIVTAENVMSSNHSNTNALHTFLTYRRCFLFPFTPKPRASRELSWACYDERSQGTLGRVAARAGGEFRRATTCV
ncbi:unnamed protein product [Timema podura]|uniref:Uncharacterized protein n=1 Tax=Timema podura TaxID=61482 RepID=A0ABN7PEC1_TIMPD|nr:unnamed protein product [Timema podura]